MMCLEEGQDGNLGRMNVRAFARGSSKEIGEKSRQRLKLVLVTTR